MMACACTIESAFHAYRTLRFFNIVRSLSVSDGRCCATELSPLTETGGRHRARRCVRPGPADFGGYEI